MKHEITAADILPLEEYENARAEKYAAVRDIERNRRIFVGPYATLYFENYDTIWLQIQEMLRSEKGGEERLTDELLAYNPLIPKGHELTATVMFEIGDPQRREEVLSFLGGVEQTMELRFAGEVVPGEAEPDPDHTLDVGKASPVQFVHFPFTEPQVAKFIQPEHEALIAITHPRYGHMASIPLNMRRELCKDFY